MFLYGHSILGFRVQSLRNGLGQYFMNTSLYYYFLSNLQIYIIIKYQRYLIGMETTPALTELMPLLNPIYPEGYHDLFMKVKLKIEKQQYTAELNDLIEQLIVFGESNYTCWVAKKRILERGETTIQDQDIYCEQVLLDNLKNFQVWDYRNFIFQTTKNYKREYEILDKIVELSPKNYHLWSNRIKVVDFVKNYGEEINNTEKYIHQDPYNNSAWAYRFYCFQKAGKTPQEVDSEIQWTVKCISEHLENEAAWNYLRGFFPSHKLKDFRNSNQILNQKVYKICLQYSKYPLIQNLCRQSLSNQKLNTIRKQEILLTLSIINSHSEQRKQFAKENLNLLIELQPYRKNYYSWLKSQI